jgi:hypothetical protein
MGVVRRLASRVIIGARRARVRVLERLTAGDHRVRSMDQPQTVMIGPHS